MRTAGSVLSSLFRELGLEDRIRLAALQKQWATLFTEPLTLHAVPVELKAGTLTIHVDSPTWLHQLQYMKNDIIAKLLSAGVNDVILRRGALPRRQPGNRAAKNDTAVSRPLTEEEKLWVEGLADSIADDELKNEIRRAAAKALSRRKK
jgi:predicted nucleic acid-binding Zn ribbon protein